MSDFYSAPPTYNRVRQKLLQLGEMYKTAKVFTAGKSVAGRDILAVSIGKQRGCNVFVGGVHGSEWLNILLLVRFIEDWLAADSGKSSLSWFGGELPDIRLTVLPCLNPDGTEIAIAGPAAAGRQAAFVESVWKDRAQVWQANLRGVDINHNFDAGWSRVKELERLAGITGPGPSRFGGTSAFSEPETRAAANLCLMLEARNLFAFHSQGEEIYWKYGENTPPRSLLIAQALADSCGYALAEPSGTASHGGLKDWFIRRTGMPGFTLETGLGKNPLPLELFPALYGRLAKALVLAAAV